MVELTTTEPSTRAKASFRTPEMPSASGYGVSLFLSNPPPGSPNLIRNIAAKIETLRTAKAEAVVKMSDTTLQLVREGNGPKGDPLPIARVAAIMAAKRTSDLIPYCHPLLIDAVEVDFEFRNGAIAATVSVTAVAKTGVEMEALTAASIAALTIYDMLKPIDEEMEILGCRLLEKKGGKSSFPALAPENFKAAILVVSDSTAAGKRDDASGKLISERLAVFGISEPELVVAADEREEIVNALLRFCEADCDLILTTGGTGAGPRDVTVEATEEIVEREMPGIAETMRAYGQRRTPYALLSRGIAGLRKNSLIINLPGSPKGVEESMSAIFPAVFHLYPMLAGEGH